MRAAPEDSIRSSHQKHRKTERQIELENGRERRYRNSNVIRFARIPRSLHTEHDVTQVYRVGLLPLSRALKRSRVCSHSQAR